ncbi:hypothetical protein EHH44_06080 [Mycolicibacter terrae]|uniref:Uncharacterized protein n=1 Tax=Mycolicibacter terrae TaxID=1788 RepID=A0ACD2EQQ8_9MYCO|nr:hypothetical protein [Mycolicibacter terrae]RRR47241.1 hypothetical protein EHH44_06080 [Mycolicibacter terrae]
MTQPWPAPPAPVRSRNWLTATLAALAVVLAAVALLVALTRTGSGSTPTYTATQKAEAKSKLCARYKVAVHSVQVETAAPDNVALARIAETNGAVIIQDAADNPALSGELRDAARALATALLTETALGTNGRDDPAFLAAVDETNEKGRVMKDLCGD